MTPGISWVSLAMLRAADSASAHALPDGTLPPVIMAPYAGKTGRARQKAARDARRKKRR